LAVVVDHVGRGVRWTREGPSRPLRRSRRHLWSYGYPFGRRYWCTGAMTDPLWAAASAATKIGSAVVARHYKAIGQQRVGGREERRQVYTRFQEAVVVYVMQIRDSRISPEAIGLEPGQRKPYIDALMTAMTELAQALYEVRLVGNPAAIEAAETVRQAISDSFDAAAARRENLTDEETERYARAMHAFTTACRLDLWYQPRWWQIWRGSWWKNRWSRGEKRQVKTGAGRASSPATLRPATHGGYDVVFGIAGSPSTRDRQGQYTNSHWENVNVAAGTARVAAHTVDTTGISCDNPSRGEEESASTNSDPAR